MFVRLFTYTPQLKKPAENLERACYIAIPTELFDSTTVVSIFLPLEHDSLSILNRSVTYLSTIYSSAKALIQYFAGSQVGSLC